jgi:hypothetical protein
MDVASSKKGVKKSTFTEASTENGKKGLNSAVKILGDRLKCLQIHLGMSDMMSLGVLSPQRNFQMSLQKNLAW